ncbi:MAG: trimethylamine methyltransferase family protein [Gammaproteobacteria bacterium]|nr:trimethylamine methyltransferase family protein [Gammaproteobacteria bacterium]
MRRKSRKQSMATIEPAFLTRRIPPYELLSEEALSSLEQQAEWLLTEIGIEIHDDPVALQLFREAGASVKGQRLRFDPGHIRALCETAPKTFTMHARNSKKNLEFGGDNLIFGAAYGSPFVTDLEGGRRYGTIEDFQNFVKLTHMSPWLHHQSGTICEPTDVAVNKRHLDMVYAHLRYGDQAFMGSVTAAERAEDSIAMAKIVFGEEFMRDHLVVQGNINVNSPLVYDNTMTSALRTYAQAGQGNVISSFIMSGAMSPVTQPALIAQCHAEVMIGIALTQLVCPGAPVVYGSFLTTMDLKSGAPTFGTPESTLATLAIGQLARRVGIPFRCGGHLTSSKLVDAQAMLESGNAMNCGVMSGANFIFQAAGWLESGLTIGYEKFVIDAEQCGALARVIQGLEFDQEQFARDAYLENGIGNSFLGSEHTMRHYRAANFDAELCDPNSFEQWRDEGGKDMQQRAHYKYKKMLAEYEMPPMDQATDEALLEFITRRKSSMDDMWY